MEIALSVVFPLIGFVLQTYTRIFNKSFGVDVWTRLIETRHVRKAKRKIPGEIKGRFLIPGHFDYPPVFPFLLSFFNEKTLVKYQGVVAPFFDSLNNLLLFFVALYFTQSVPVAMLAQAIYTFTPVIALENSSLTPRSIGYLVMNLAIVSSILFVDTRDVIFFVSSIAFTSLIFLTHRFATQSLLFLSLFFSIYLSEAYYVAVFLLGLLISLYVTRGYYFRVLAGHLANIYFWVINRELRFAHQIRGLRSSKQKEDFVSFLYTMLSKFAPITLLGTNLWIFSVFTIIVSSYFNLLEMGLDNFVFVLAGWSVFFYVLGIPILTVKRLRCIGEGYRYMEMAALPTSLLASWLFFELVDSGFSFFGIVAYSLIFAVSILSILAVHWKIIKDKGRSVSVDLLAMYGFLNKSKTKYKILCIPHQITTSVLFHTRGHKVFVNADNLGLMSLDGVYPVIKFPIEDVMEKHKLDVILLNESFAALKELKLKKYKMLFESGNMKVIKV